MMINSSISSLKEQIIFKISNIHFSNGAKLQDMISEIIIKEGKVGFAINITSDINIKEAENLRDIAINAIQSIDAVEKCTIVLTSDNNLKDNSSAKKKYIIDNVKKVILVASGKGGVGKSTISMFIAERLNILGYNVGVIDADIYGPSLSHLVGMHDKPEIINNKIMPLKAKGLQLMSIGFLIDKERAIPWRGPMVSKALYQLLSLTSWDNLDYLIVDMPPGTGDIHLSILENYKLDGVIMITTPQLVSMIDVEKAINLYKKFNLKLLGIIENMSYLIDNSNKKIKIFHGNSAQILSQKYNIPLIAQLPLNPLISEACDSSSSIVDLLDLPIERFL